MSWQILRTSKSSQLHDDELRKWSGRTRSASPSTSAQSGRTQSRTTRTPRREACGLLWRKTTISLSSAQTPRPSRAGLTLVAERLGSETLLGGHHLGRCAVFIGSTDLRVIGRGIGGCSGRERRKSAPSFRTSRASYLRAAESNIRAVRSSSNAARAPAQHNDLRSSLLSPSKLT